MAGDSIIYSASDLASAARCEYALLREFDARLGWGQRLTVTDELLERTASLGDEHEQRRLDQLRDEHGGCRRNRPSVPFTVENVTAAAAATRRAIDHGAPVIYQAAMFDGRFVGFADFLVRRDGTYQVSDTKLARSAKVTALLQIAAYADTLAHSGIAVHPDAELVLGNGVVVNYRVDELVPVYREQRMRLQRLLDEHYAHGSPVRWDDEQVRACFRCPVCEEQVRATDDLLLVAGMRVSQRATLLDAGISTVAELAERAVPVANVSARSLKALVAQASCRSANATPARHSSRLPTRSRSPCCPTGMTVTCSSTSRAIRCGRPTGPTGVWNICSVFSKAARRAPSTRCGRTTGPTSGKR